MNTVVELVNAWGGRFVDAAWPMLWQSSVLMALVFALDLILRKRVRATARYALWLLVLAKLVVPASLSLPTGVGYWVPAPKALTAARPGVVSALRAEKGHTDESRPAATSVVQAASVPQADLVTRQTLQEQPNATSAQSLQLEAAQQRGPTDIQTTSAAGQTLHWRGVAALGWLAGMAGLSGVLAFRARLTRRMIANATATEEFSGLLSKGASRLGVRRRVALKLSGAAATPAVCGLFRPVILLPTALVSRLSAAQLEAVLLHELAHVRRGDPWVNYFQALLQIVYFYNPLLWLANAAIRRVREEAVDELVLVAMADEAALYPEVLLQVAKFSMQTPRPGFGWVGILEKRSTVGGRIRLMLHRPWPKSARLGLRGGIAVAVLAAALLPMKSRPQQENPASSVASSLRLDSSPTGNPSQQQLPSRQGLVPSGSPQVNALCAAISERRWQDASKMIDNGVWVNGVDEKRRTPLGCLVEQWHNWKTQDETPGEEVLQKLLQHGADPFAPSAKTGNADDIRTPMETAMGYADTILGGILITNNPSPVRRTPSGEDALRLALRLSPPFMTKGGDSRMYEHLLLGQHQTRTNLIDFLLSHGFSADQTNKDGITALQEMAWSPVDGPFIATGNPPPYFMHTLSASSGLNRDAIVADFLLSRGATVDVFSAAGMGLTNQLAALLRANPKLANTRYHFGRTPLHFAVASQSNTTALLLQAGADPAIQISRLAPANTLSPSYPFPAGFSPLKLAIWADNLASVQLLLKAGAPLAQPDAEGNTPLHFTVPYRTNIQKLLISADAPLDLTNREGKTALRLAVEHDNGEDVELLLKAGARKDIGLDNTTILHIAATREYAHAIPPLLAASLPVDARDSQGRTPFQLAVTALKLEAMELLLTNGADINAVDLHGDTALHQLSIQPREKVVILPRDKVTGLIQIPQQGSYHFPMMSLTGWLLEHGANPNLTNRDGQTPLDLLRTHKWANANDEKEAADRIAALLKAGAKSGSSRMQPENPAFPARTPSPEQLPSRQGLVPSASASAGVDALCVAIIDGRYQSALQMIDSGVAVNGAGEQQRTPLACLVDSWRRGTPQDKERLEVLQKLLEHGADPFARSATTNYQRILPPVFLFSASGVQPAAPSDTTDNPNARLSPVEKAVKRVDGMLGDILLTNNPSPFRRTPSSKNALDLALRPFRKDIVDFLLAHGFSANQTNADGLTPLQEMAGLARNNSFIPARKPPPYFVHSQGEWVSFPFLYVDKSDFGEAIVADFLLSRGATVDVFSAAGMGLTNQLAALLRSNPKLANARDSFGRTPLHYAASGQSNATALLLKAGADSTARTTRPVELTPNADVFERRSVLPAGSSPLHFACLRENQVTAQLLVKAAAPLDQPDADGNTPLHDAVQHVAHQSNNTNLTRLLISADAPLDLTNRAGQTPLRLALQSGSSADVKLLLEAGARKDIGLENTTLLHIAAAQGSAVAVLPTLLASGLAVDARDSQGRTPFQCAVTNLNLAAMELLLTNGTDINAMDFHGDTALHQLCLQRVDGIYLTQGEEARRALAAKREPPWLHLTGWLLDHGANPNLTNHEGRTPLELLRTYKWDSPWERSEAAARIALLLKAGAQDK